MIGLHNLPYPEKLSDTVRRMNDKITWLEIGDIGSKSGELRLARLSCD
jgi:hypothetical protein